MRAPALPLCMTLTLVLTAAEPRNPFVIHVTDEQTARGVPLVELRTLNEISFITDSAGVAAIDDPTLGGREVAFAVRSHGYEFPQKLLDRPGVRLTVAPGGRAELKLHRINLAERLYRVTGAGIYQDSVAARLPVPLAEPLLNGGVAGQDARAEGPGGSRSDVPGGVLVLRCGRSRARAQSSSTVDRQGVLPTGEAREEHGVRCRARHARVQEDPRGRGIGTGAGPGGLSTARRRAPPRSRRPAARRLDSELPQMVIHVEVPPAQPLRAGKAAE